MLFIGPSLMSGIGQHVKKYTALFPGSAYVELGDPDALPPCDEAFVFALPTDPWLTKIPALKRRIGRLACMTVCETETVHEDYGRLFALFDRVAVPSAFCQRVFSRQFPGTDFYIVHAHVPRDDRYVFYHVGNVLDPRKNVRAILEAFVRLNEPEARLVIKATCMSPVEIKLPNVQVINELLTDEEMSDLHRRCDCYVSCSHSEGVGMGAVEAALHGNPVITPEYGATTEYVKTPFTIPCGLATIERDDFLFKKGMRWGAPDVEALGTFMRRAFDLRLRHVDHEHTVRLTSAERVLDEFLLNGVGGQKRDEPDEESA